MKPTRWTGLLFGLALVAADAPAGEPAPAAQPGPKVVLRISRSFVHKLTRREFADDSPIQTSAQGATVVGVANVSGGYDVKLHKSDAGADIDLLVSGAINTRATVTRRPVVLALTGTTPLEASRRVAFDGKTFAGQPVSVGVCYHSNLEGVCTLRNGPAAPLVRRLARPVVLRSLPEADRAADRDIRTEVCTKVTEETDKIVAVLNALIELREYAVEQLDEKLHLKVQRHRLAVAATEETIVAGVGFAPGESPRLPAAAGPPAAPVEIWVYHPVSVQEEVAFAFIEPKLRAAWEEKVKPKARQQLARHAPKLADLLDDATAELRFHAIPNADPNWHVVRFSKKLHDAAPTP